MTDCPFCARIKAGEYDEEYDGIVDFEPLNPVTPGHRLVVPKIHVADALEDGHVAGMVMAYAANRAKTAGLAPCNLITSAGPAASQTVFHLHLHIVPRRPGDGLTLPWTQEPKCAYCYCKLSAAPECAGGDCTHRSLSGYAGCVDVTPPR